MTSALEEAKSHFSSRTNKHIDVPEWKMKVFFSDMMTIRQRDRIFNRDDGRPTTGFVASARTVMLMALGEDGKRLFSDTDLHALQHEVDQSVVMRIATAILEATGQSRTPTEQIDDSKN